MRSFPLLIAFLLTASAALASPVITSVTPNAGPISGGTTVVIRGTGFSDYCIFCTPALIIDPEVFFDGVRATDVEFIDSTTLEVVTPPHVPGSVSVVVTQSDGSDPDHDTLANGFTYQGDVYDAYDPVLFPIFTPPVFGVGGSEFRTSAEFWNRGHQPVTFFGFDTTCTLIDPPLTPDNPFTLAPRQTYALNLWPDCSQFTGKLFLVPKGDKSLAASLRVWEVTRQGENHGVEIPVVRRADFDEESIALVGVPTDPKFRLALRIYGLNQGSQVVNVTFDGRTVQVPMYWANTPFEPSYAVFTDFTPLPGNTILPLLNVLVEVPRGPNGEHIPGTPIWAFITVTNNETQAITTITPQH